MIIVARNDVLNAVDLMVDAAGVDLLIERLVRLKAEMSKSHLHVDDLGIASPYGHENVFSELVIQWIGEPNLFGEQDK